MRLNNYLLEDENTSRSITILEEKALHLVFDNCQNVLRRYFQNDSFIYRDFASYHMGDFLYVEPSKHTRKSRNTFNYYTLIMDNSPLWKDYPKRSRSIICGTKGVSRNYIVFPFDGSKIGVCPDADLWMSFDHELLKDLETFTESLKSILDFYMLDTSDSNITIFKQSLKYIDSQKNKKIGEKAFDYEGVDDIDTRNLLNAYNDSKKPFWDFLVSLFDPKKYGFRLKKVGDELPTHSEVWTDGNSVLVSNDEHREFMKKIRYRFDNEDK